MTDKYIVKGGKALRAGYTTGSCAAAAATAATEMLFTGIAALQAGIKLPGGETVFFDIVAPWRDGDTAACAVIKDAGDDPDVTDGIYIYATCTLQTENITVDGGWGVGVITTDGLSVPKGKAAINPVPMKMIIEGVKAVCKKYEYTGGIKIVISAPGGEKRAKKTFNPRLGIEGGISILGTTGIVEPMSEKAVVNTIKLVIDKKRLEDDFIILTPGNYAMAYCRDTLGIDTQKAVKCSNYIGESLDYIVYKKFEKMLLVGHVGKFIKLAAGIMNTHSAVADGRLEVLASHAALIGADKEKIHRLMKMPTTEAAITQLDNWRLTEDTFKSIMEKILFHVNYRTKGAIRGEVIIFAGERTLARGTL